MSESYKKLSKFLKLENSKEVLHNAQEASTSKRSDQEEKAEKKKGSENKKAEEKRGNNPKKSQSGLADHKAPLLKYTNYHALNAPQDHIYTMTNKNLFRKSDEIRGNKSRRDVRKNCTYHKDTGHNTMKCNALRDEIERSIQARHFKEFLENEPQVVVTNERPRQRSPERIKEVLTIFEGPHVSGESQNTRDKYAKDAQSAPLTHVHRTDKRLVKSVRQELKDVVFTEVDTRWVHYPHSDALVITARVANSNVHMILVYTRSDVDIIYLDAYKRMRLT